MSTLKLEASTGNLEIFPSPSTSKIFPITSTLENEVQKYVKYARLRHAISKALGLGNDGKVLSLVFQLLLLCDSDTQLCTCFN